MVERLRWKGEVDAFGIEALNDLFVDPGGVLQVIPPNTRRGTSLKSDFKERQTEFHSYSRRFLVHSTFGIETTAEAGK